jgi:hypothetical protein
MATVKPPLTLPVMTPVTMDWTSKAFSSIVPRLGAAGLLARQAGLAGPVFEHFNHDFHGVADLDGHFAAGVLELGHGNHGFGLESGVDDDDVFIHVHDFAGDRYPECTHLPPA